MDFDSVKIEKANAIMRYLLFRRFAKLLQIAEIVFALTLFSWSSTHLPASFKFSGDYLVKLFANFFSTHAVFLIGNAIIVALVFLSRQNSSGKTAGDTDFADNEGVCIHQRVAVSSPECEFEKRVVSLSSPVSEPEDTTDDKQIVCVENEQCQALENAIEEAKRKIRRFERTQSEKLRGEISSKSRRVLRRSETERREIVAASGDGRVEMTSSLDKVDSMSNEEFQLTIDAFIKKHQRFITAQNNSDRN